MQCANNNLKEDNCEERINIFLPEEKACDSLYMSDVDSANVELVATEEDMMSNVENSRYKMEETGIKEASEESLYFTAVETLSKDSELERNNKIKPKSKKYVKKEKIKKGKKNKASNEEFLVLMSLKKMIYCMKCKTYQDLVVQKVLSIILLKFCQ